MRVKFIILLLMLLGVQTTFAQDLAISGTVTDETTGETLIGVNIFVMGTTSGTITDIDGNYSITVSPGAVLSFSYTGYSPQEIVVGTQTIINVQLSAGEVLEEVVVVGYGVQKKESVVGSITQTTGEQLEQRFSGSDIANSLTGVMPGVVTIRESGIPGGSGEDDQATKIFIRGQSTWNGGEPLVLVDGVERTMNDVDPNQIESMSVLKDASATAVFGVKGANGVILITTKRGAEGKPTLSFETQITAKTLSKLYPMLNSYEGNVLKNYAIVNELAISEGSWQDYTPYEVLDYYRTQQYPELYPDVDWQEATSQDVAWTQKVGMNVSGGTKFVKYFGALSYLSDGDILKTEDYGQGYDPNFSYNRFNFRSNLDFSITPTTTFSVNLAGYYGKQQRPAGDKWNFWKGITGRPPDLYPVRYSDGVWADYAGFDRYENSVARLNFGGLENENRSEINTDFILDQKLDFITEGLSFNARLAYDNRFNTLGYDISDGGVLEKWIDNSVVFDPAWNDNLPAEQQQDLLDKYTIWQFPGEFDNATHGYNYVELPNTVQSERTQTNILRALFYQLSLNYARSFGPHDVGVTFLMNRRENATGSAFISYREDWVGRITYGLNSKYFLEFNGAYNGSERFDRQNRFGFFPSVGLSWYLSNESFWDPMENVINKVKLRYSNGLVGNDSGIARWLYVGGYDITNSNWQFGSPFSSGSYPWRLEGTIPNPDIRWETAHKQNIGVDLGFANSAFELTFDYFWEDREDMFLSANQRNIPVFFGADPVGINAGQVKTHGFEIEGRLQKPTPGTFNYYIHANLGFAKDEVIYREDPELAPEYQKQAGYQIGQTRTQLNQEGAINSWDQIYTGVMGEDNTQSLPGDFRQIDFNADGKINADDNVPWGYPSRPQYSYGTTLGFDYKGLSLMVQFYGVFNVTSATPYGEFGENYTLVRPLHWNESWLPEWGRTTAATYPHVRYNTNSGKGQYWQTDRSYTKLQNVELAYKLPSAFISKLGLSNLRLALSGNNLFLWSRHLVEDRDVDSNTNRSYPLLRYYSFGARASF